MTKAKVITEEARREAREAAKKAGGVTPEAYWMEVLADVTATPSRRDRAAEMLTLYYRGQTSPKGVRSQAKADASELVKGKSKFTPAAPPQGH